MARETQRAAVGYAEVDTGTRMFSKLILLVVGYLVFVWYIWRESPPA